MRLKCLSLWLVVAGCLIGCNSPTPGNKSGEGAKKAEEEIKLAFTALQVGIKAKDSDKIWSLLAKDSRDDADHQAKPVREAFANLPENEKPNYEKKFALTSKELTDMTGQLYVKSKAFYDGETDEMPSSKLEKVVVAGESATVQYIEDDGKGQHEKRTAVRENGQWKFNLPIPKAVLK